MKEQQFLRHGEILPPGIMPEERDICLTVSQYFMEEHPAPVFFLAIHNHKQDFGEEVMDALLGGLERLAIRAVRLSMTLAQARPGVCPES